MIAMLHQSPFPMQLTFSLGSLSLCADSKNGCKDLLTDTAKLPLPGVGDTLTMCNLVEPAKGETLFPWIHSNISYVQCLCIVFPSVSMLQIVADYVSVNYLVPPKLLISENANRNVPVVNTIPGVC